MTNETTKSAIILVYSSNTNLEQLKHGLIKCCDDNNLSIIKIIEAENEHHCKALIELCHSVRKGNNNCIGLQ